ncbi:MAG: DMT family transporter [Pseudomonadota bacterium]
MPTENVAMVAVALSAFAWGIYWIPLRAMDEAGIVGAWSIVMFNILPVALLAPVLILRWRAFVFGGWRLHVAGFLAGSAMVTYAGALIYTDVVRALLLYYLTPIWSTVFAWLFLREAITRVRWMTIALGLFGVMVLVRIETGFDLEFNAGDWMGLIAGVIWALAAVLLNGGEVQGGTDYTLSYFIWGSVAALLLTLVPLDGAAAAPDWETIWGVLPWLIPVVLVIVIPPAFAIMWGATIISPGLLAILFMTEISAGTITAAIWAGEIVGPREIVGVVLVSLAGLLEPVRKMWIGGSERQGPV